MHGLLGLLSPLRPAKILSDAILRTRLAAISRLGILVRVFFDRLGFSLRLKTIDGMKGGRINFLHEATTPQDTRAQLVEMVRQIKAPG